MLTELATCLRRPAQANATPEFAAFWRELNPNGPPADEIAALIAAGGRVQLVSTPPGPQAEAVTP